MLRQSLRPSSALAWSPPLMSALAWSGKGIGTYDDTPGSPPLSQQLDLARDLVGSGYTIIFLSQLLDPAPPTPHALAAKLEAAYGRSLRVVVRLGWSGATRDLADPGSNQSRYTSMARRLARIVEALPLPPPHLGPLLLHAGNELNACNEWRCDDPGGRVLTLADRASEVGGFMSDTQDAFANLTAVQNGSVWLAHASLANWNYEGCECGTNDAVGEGRKGTPFLPSLLARDPGLYRRGARWLSSHSYPFSNANYSSDPDSKAFRGLTYYRAELELISWRSRPIGASLPVVITETGWARAGADNPVSGDDQAAWLRRAADEIWIPDAAVLAVCPFLLGGRFWEASGRNFVTCPASTNASETCDGELTKLAVYEAWRAAGTARPPPADSTVGV